jgi:1-acyl-sn-glycerol-3-phosphate acyltransferase
LSTIGSPPPYRFNWFDRFCLWYPPGWLIVFNRHWQHYKPDPQGWIWLEYPLFLLPGGFYLAMLLRWLRLGLRSPQHQTVEPDPAYQQAFQREILSPIVHRYFRGALTGLENLPPTGTVMVAMNHAGMCFPWDFVSLGLLIDQQRGWQVQPLAHPLFFEHPWLAWWLPGGWAQVLGGIPADRASFEQAIADRKIVIFAPEGWRGLAKGWHQRYRLTTFDPSFVRLSIQHHVPVLPIVCLGSESLHPFTFNAQPLARWLKLPLFPLSPLLLAFILFPSLGVWAARSRLRYQISPLWCPWANLSSGESPSRSRLYELAEGLRSQLQSQIDALQASPTSRS